jgi:hypothetical protein
MGCLGGFFDDPEAPLFWVPFFFPQKSPPICDGGIIR